MANYPGYSSRIPELLIAQGQSQAQRALQHGQNIGQMLSTLGNIAAAVPGQIVQAQAEAKAKKEVDLAHSLAQQALRPDGTTDFGFVVRGLRQAGAHDAANEVEKKWQSQRVADASIQKDTLGAQNIQSEMTARGVTTDAAKAKAARDAADYEATHAKGAEVASIIKKHAASNGGTITNWQPVIDDVRMVDPVSADELLRNWQGVQKTQSESQTAKSNALDVARRDAATRLSNYTTPQDYANRRAQLAPEVQDFFPAQPPKNRRDILKAGLTPKEQLDADVAQQRADREGQTSPTAEPLVAVIGKDGKPVLVRRGQAEGMTPASTREQGRAVTSGDAGDLADFDTSMDDLRVLRSVVAKNGATGVEAQVGAALPNWVTNITGLGTEAKKKQAVIDRVKQVIGKTLEGGVLRKEDEYKYEKILPTISDNPGVVLTKLGGLETAITLRKSRRMDALGDAGYDVSRFQSRTGQQAPSLQSGLNVTIEPIVVTAPDNSKHSFATQAEAAAFKKLAGIK